MNQLRNEKYVRAIDAFTKIKTDFPFSPQLTGAELKLAEAYYLNKQYPEAAAAFKEFQDLHPSNENIPFVVYHLGLAYFDQFTSIDRDQKVTEIAKGYFENVIKNYPKSPYVAAAQEKLAKCQGYLAEHEFYIASFYLREKKYPAARDHLERILRQYSDTPIAVKSLYHLGESYRLENNSVKAALAYEALIQRYPDSPFSKEAKVQLAEVEKEKQDPLKMLLMRDGRPASTAPPEGSESSTASARQKSQELNLIAKKEVVYEEPGEQKGAFRRVFDTLNPFYSDKKDNGAKKIEASKKEPLPKEQSDGFLSSFWRGLNPFASEKPRVEAPRNPQLVNEIDESLKQKGIANASQNTVVKAPTPDLPKAEDVAAPPTNTAALVGDVDDALKKQGKSGSDLPPLPEIAPALKTSTAEASKPATPKTASSPPQSATGLISNIDEALKRKGIEPAKVEASTKSTEQRPQLQESNRQPSAVSSQQKIQLDTKLAPEKGPFLLESEEFQPPENPPQSEQEKTKAPTEEQEPSREIPKSVVKGPTPPFNAIDKPAETPQVTERKKSPDENEEQNKGVFDQLKDDLGRLRGMLNPFSW